MLGGVRIFGTGKVLFGERADHVVCTTEREDEEATGEERVSIVDDDFFV